jgi:hypothetical protein
VPDGRCNWAGAHERHRHAPVCVCVCVCTWQWLAGRDVPGRQQQQRDAEAGAAARCLRVACTPALCCDCQPWPAGAAVARTHWSATSDATDEK